MVLQQFGGTSAVAYYSSSIYVKASKLSLAYYSQLDLCYV
jgi:hypothetical protein